MRRVICTGLLLKTKEPLGVKKLSAPSKALADLWLGQHLARHYPWLSMQIQREICCFSVHLQTVLKSPETPRRLSSIPDSAWGAQSTAASSLQQGALWLNGISLGKGGEHGGKDPVATGDVKLKWILVILINIYQGNFTLLQQHISIQASNI